MRFATYNVEWFTHLFDREGELLRDGGWSGRQDVTRAEQIDALVTVFRTLDADAIMVVEAPDSNSRRSATRSLEAFAAHAGIRARRALMGFANDTEQEIVLLYDPDRIEAAHDPGDTPEAPRFDGTFRIDLDIDDALDVVSFSKPPLELSILASDTVLRMIGVHVKSKAPHGAASREETIRLSIAARRKQLAQCIWLRHRVEETLDRGEPLIVLGDFNDGPGLDEYEKLFGRSGVEIVMGEGAPPRRRLHDPHARLALKGRLSAQPSSARFFLGETGGYLHALLDYIMLSPDLAARGPHWRIWHPFDDPACYGDTALREALLTASDHFPVTLDIELGG